MKAIKTISYEYDEIRENGILKLGKCLGLIVTFMDNTTMNYPLMEAERIQKIHKEQQRSKRN